MKVLNKVGMTIATLLVACILSGTLSRVHADTYYGNGVYCNRHTCHVDWGKAWDSIGHIVANGWMNHGPLAPHDN